MSLALQRTPQTRHGQVFPQVPRASQPHYQSYQPCLCPLPHRPRCPLPPHRRHLPPPHPPHLPLPHRVSQSREACSQSRAGNGG